MNDIIALLEKTYEENQDFKNIIDKIPLIESIYKGLNVSDKPQIIKLIENIKTNQPDKTITFGNITYDYEDFINIVRKSGIGVQTGKFAAMMDIELINDGPVTFLLQK